MRTAAAVDLVALVALLAMLDAVMVAGWAAALDATSTSEGPAGLGVLPWLVGLTCGLVVTGAVVRGARRGGVETLGPADVVTLTRMVLACAVAALVSVGLAHPAPPLLVPALVSVAGVALTLDAVDGRVARRTRTASAFGARFDGEADAFLILVLSVYVARSAGAWVLLIGLARYLFAAAGWALPWLRGRLPVRPWAKAVAAIQGVVLVVAAADVLPRSVTTGTLVVALALLTESFAWSVRWLWQHRSRTVRASGAVREDGALHRVSDRAGTGER